MSGRFAALALLPGLLVMLAGCATSTEPGPPPPAWPPGLAVLDAPRALMEREVVERLPLPAPALPPDVPAAPAAASGEGLTGPAPGQAVEPPPPPPRPAGTTAFIARDRVNLRPCAEETPRCPPIAALRLREEVRVTEEAEAWLLVRVPRLGRDGYIARRFASATLPPPDAVVAAPVATPARDPHGPAPAGKRAREERSPGSGTRSAPPPEEELLQ